MTTLIINNIDFAAAFEEARQRLHAKIDRDVHRRRHFPARSAGQRRRWARVREERASLDALARALPPEVFHAIATMRNP